MKYSINDIKKNLDSNNFNFKKKFGQNFIIDENIINGIINKSEIDSDSLVIEIGPGAGSLTYKLCKIAKNVLCYEIDDSLKDILSSNLEEYNNVDIIYKDFLVADVKNDIKKYNYSKLYVVANLPYYITTPIISKIITDKIDVDKIVVMVQKEVGDRFRATPGTKEYNSLSIFLQYNYNIKKIMEVSKNVFIPKPNVDSIVVMFTKHDKEYVKDIELFYKLVKDSFVQKRKTLKNNLKGYDLDKVEMILKKYGYDLSVTAENLSIKVFIDIANNL